MDTGLLVFLCIVGVIALGLIIWKVRKEVWRHGLKKAGLLKPGKTLCYSCNYWTSWRSSATGPGYQKETRHYGCRYYGIQFPDWRPETTKCLACERGIHKYKKA